MAHTPVITRKIRQRAAKRGLRRHRDVNHLLRVAASRLAQSKDLNICETVDYPNSTAGAGDAHHQLGGSLDGPSARRHHQEQDLQNLLAEYPAVLRRRGREARAPQVPHCFEVEEGRDLARSEIPLPSDRFRLVRRPTLEREEAFRVASTAKGNVHILHASEDAQIAELYQQGLLYDSCEQVPEDVFNLNNIQHEQPIYTIRPAKRGRKSKKSGGGAVSHQLPLHLSLSFTDLGEDQGIAQYTYSDPSTDVIGHESIQHETPNTAEAFPPLRVIYELTSSNPTFDVETSQPPDLVTDILSDYDCFSDSEMDDDLPTQREVHENANNPSSETWIMLD